MRLTTRGVITRVFEKRCGVSKAGKTWASQDYGFVEDGSEDMVVFNIFGEDTISNVALKEGEDVTITFDVRSREYNGRYYTEVRFIECEKMAPAANVASDTVAQDPKKATPTQKKPTAESKADGENSDELPF